MVSFAWGLTSFLRARSLWHQHVVLSQQIPLCSLWPHSTDSGAPEKSWKGHLAVEVKGMSFRESRTFLYSLLSLSSLRETDAVHRWGWYFHGTKRFCTGLCGTINAAYPRRSQSAFQQGLGGDRETGLLWRPDGQDHDVCVWRGGVLVIWPQHSRFHMYPAANTHTHTPIAVISTAMRRKAWMWSRLVVGHLETQKGLKAQSVGFNSI